MAHKGVPHAEARKMSLDVYVDCIYNNKKCEVTSRELRRNDKQQMIYYESVKRGLNPVFKKYRVQEDKISCLPLCKNGNIL